MGEETACTGGIWRVGGGACFASPVLGAGGAESGFKIRPLYDYWTAAQVGFIARAEGWARIEGTIPVDSSPRFRDFTKGQRESARRYTLKPPYLDTTTSPIPAIPAIIAPIVDSLWVPYLPFSLYPSTTRTLNFSTSSSDPPSLLVLSPTPAAACSGSSSTFFTALSNRFRTSYRSTSA